MSPVIQLQSAIINAVKNGAQTINMSQWLRRTSLECVGRAALGHSFGPLRNFSTRHGDAVDEVMFVYLASYMP